MFRLADLHIICKFRQKALRLFNPELAQWFHRRRFEPNEYDVGRYNLYLRQNST